MKTFSGIPKHVEDILQGTTRLLPLAPQADLERSAAFPIVLRC